MRAALLFVTALAAAPGVAAALAVSPGDAKSMARLVWAGVEPRQ